MPFQKRETAAIQKASLLQAFRSWEVTRVAVLSYRRRAVLSSLRGEHVNVHRNIPFSCTWNSWLKAELLQKTNTITKKPKKTKLDFKTCWGLPETKIIKINKSNASTLAVFWRILFIKFLWNYMMRSKMESHLGSQSSSSSTPNTWWLNQNCFKPVYSCSISFYLKFMIVPGFTNGLLIVTELLLGSTLKISSPCSCGRNFLMF